MKKPKTESINPKKESLTKQKLEDLTGKIYSEGAAEKIIDDIKTLSSILLEYTLEQEQRQSTT